MSETNNKSYSGGVGVFGLLGVLFVGLKLAGIIDWSWWWVTAPFWGGFAIGGVIIVFGLSMYIFALAIEAHKKSKNV